MHQKKKHYIAGNVFVHKSPIDMYLYTCIAQIPLSHFIDSNKFLGICSTQRIFVFAEINSSEFETLDNNRETDTLKFINDRIIWNDIVVLYHVRFFSSIILYNVRTAYSYMMLLWLNYVFTILQNQSLLFAYIVKTINSFINVTDI